MPNTISSKPKRLRRRKWASRSVQQNSVQNPEDDKNKKDWHERLPEALWAYRTTCRTPTQATPYSLVFGGEEVLPLEVHLFAGRNPGIPH
ncbi:hypothetical protein LguiA_035983 [Lonicera macranthoides]